MGRRALQQCQQQAELHPHPSGGTHGRHTGALRAGIGLHGVERVPRHGERQHPHPPFRGQFPLSRLQRDISFKRQHKRHVHNRIPLQREPRSRLSRLYRNRCRDTNDLWRQPDGDAHPPRWRSGAPVPRKFKLGKGLGCHRLRQTPTRYNRQHQQAASTIKTSTALPIPIWSLCATRR